MSNVPNGWASTTLKEIAKIVGGVTKDTKKANSAGFREVPYLRVANVQRGRLDLSEIKTIAASEKDILKLRLLPGDILLNEGGDRDKLGRGWIWQNQIAECIHQNHVFRARLRGQQIDPLYVAHFTNSEAQSYFFEHGSQTTNLASISMTKLGSLPIRLPPSKEQERIVAALDERLSELDASVASLERAERNLVRYRAAVLAAACSGKLVPTEADIAGTRATYEPADQLLARILAERRTANTKAKYEEPTKPDTSKLPKLPGGWAVASLEQLTSVARPICYGILMPKENVATGVLFVKVKDMKGDRINLEGLHRTTPEIAAKFSRASLRTGDLLLSIRGTYGRVAEVPKELNHGNITQDTARLDITRFVDHRYVATCLRNPVSQNYFKRVARGVAVKGVNIGDVRPMAIPLPPLTEQERIVAEVDRHLSRADALAASIALAKRRALRLRRAILAAAFEGRLVPQDPNDEPASVLLERIRVERVADVHDGKLRASGPRSQGRKAAVAAMAVATAMTDVKTPKRRGRPPGAKNKGKA